MAQGFINKCILYTDEYSELAEVETVGHLTLLSA
jgi:hypothetical protein